MRLVGGYDPPEALRRTLDRPSVTVCGHSTIRGGVSLRHRDGRADADQAGGRACASSPRSRTAARSSRTRRTSSGSRSSRTATTSCSRADADGLADGLVRAVRDDELRRRLEERGRETFERLLRPRRRGRAAGRDHARDRRGVSRRRARARRARGLSQQLRLRGVEAQRTNRPKSVALRNFRVVETCSANVCALWPMSHSSTGSTFISTVVKWTASGGTARGRSAARAPSSRRRAAAPRGATQAARVFLAGVRVDREAATRVRTRARGQRGHAEARRKPSPTVPRTVIA